MVRGDLRSCSVQSIGCIKSLGRESSDRGWCEIMLYAFNWVHNDFGAHVASVVRVAELNSSPYHVKKSSDVAFASSVMSSPVCYDELVIGTLTGLLSQLVLMSHDGQNVLVTTYSELKTCFLRSFTELMQASTTSPTHKLS